MSKASKVRARRMAHRAFRRHRAALASAALLGSLPLTAVAHAEYHDFSEDYALGRGAPMEDRRSIRERSFAAKPVMVELRTGFGTIVGLAGATISFDPWSRLCLGVGLGANTAGVQLAAFARVRPLVFMSKRRARLHAVGVELGYSRGPFDFFAIGERSGLTYTYERVQWLQPQITYETRSYRGFNLLAGVGLEIPIEKSGFRCIDQWDCYSQPLSALPTVTLGLGWATGL